MNIVITVSVSTNCLFLSKFGIFDGLTNHRQELSKTQFFENKNWWIPISTNYAGTLIRTVFTGPFVMFRLQIMYRNRVWDIAFLNVELARAELARPVKTYALIT